MTSPLHKKILTLALVTQIFCACSKAPEYLKDGEYHPIRIGEMYKFTIPAARADFGGLKIPVGYFGKVEKINSNGMIYISGDEIGGGRRVPIWINTKEFTKIEPWYIDE